MPQTQVIGGNQSPVPNTPISVDPSFQAARVSIRPTEFQAGPGGIGGHFRASLVFSNTAAQGAVPLVSFRWAPANSFLAVLKRIEAMALITTVFTTAQAIDLKATKVTGYTVDATGGTENAPLADQRNRTGTMATSLLNSLRTGNLTAGTRTLNAFPFGSAVVATGNTALAGVVAPAPVLYKWDAFGQHPMVFGSYEGFEIAPVTSLGAAGVVQYYITLEWAEVPQF